MNGKEKMNSTEGTEGVLYYLWYVYIVLVQHLYITWKFKPVREHDQKNQSTMRNIIPMIAGDAKWHGVNWTSVDLLLKIVKNDALLPKIGQMPSTTVPASMPKHAPKQNYTEILLELQRAAIYQLLLKIKAVALDHNSFFLIYRELVFLFTCEEPDVYYLHLHWRGIFVSVGSIFMLVSEFVLLTLDFDHFMIHKNLSLIYLFWMLAIYSLPLIFILVRHHSRSY